MKYLLTTGWEDGVAALTECLVGKLAAKEQVLWLVSGGSNIPASVSIIKNISLELRQNLKIMLIDERYGPVGHADSNFAQLLRSGFAGENAPLLPVLYAGLSLEQTVQRYEETVKAAFAEATYAVAQLGMGEDGHIAGILPNSPAAHELTALVSGYESGDLTRITLTFPAVRQLSSAYVFAFGTTKHQALGALMHQRLSLTAQPAQVLKELPQVYLYNDQLGEQS